MRRHGWIVAALSAICISGAIAQPVLLTSPATIGPTDTAIIPSAGGPAVPLATAEITVQGTQLVISGRHIVGSLEVLGGGVVRHAPNVVHDYSGGGTDVVHGVHLIVLGDVYIDETSRLDVSSMGSPGGVGPGAGGTGNAQFPIGEGASYGGSGRSAYRTRGGDLYGSHSAPTLFGSGGGRGWISGGLVASGPGGGAIRIDASGRIEMHGRISSNGGDGTSLFRGAGSGGSIWLRAHEISGTGIIEANGGKVGQPGGGGRIALEANFMLLWEEPRAWGGMNNTGVNGGGGPGTVFINIPGFMPTLMYTQGTSGLGANAPTELDEPMEVEGVLYLKSGATLTHAPANENGLRITVNGDVVLEGVAGFDVTGRGYPSGQGPGAGGSGTPSFPNPGNASYGGTGKRNGVSAVGRTYGSYAEPSHLGSGGGAKWTETQMVPGGAGGGLIRLDISGSLSGSGFIRANGEYSQGAGSAGSGGSILIRVSIFNLTSSQVHAIGGPYGGGGGRLAYIYDQINTFGNQIASDGGGSTAGSPGGPGTVYRKHANQIGRLSYNHSTTLQQYVITELHDDLVVDGNLSVSNRVRLIPAPDRDGVINIRVSGDMYLTTFAEINASGAGFGPADGPGAGLSGAAPDGAGSGAGHGGLGGAAGALPGGAPYGSVALPMLNGSGGGNAFSSGVLQQGGRGGGRIRIDVGGTFSNFSRVFSNGGDAQGPAAGGGAGGSIIISAQAFADEASGIIQANGGSGGAGGAGGRIALYTCDPDIFNQTRADAGAPGAAAGTISIAQAAVEVAASMDAICTGGEARLYALAGGVGQFAFTWMRDGVALTDGETAWGSVLSGTETNELVIQGLNPEDAGAYTVRLSTVCAVVTSEPHVLGWCIADMDCSGALDDLDIAAFFDAFQSGDAAADLDASGGLDDLDIAEFFSRFEAGC